MNKNQLGKYISLTKTIQYINKFSDVQYDRKVYLNKC